MEIKKVKNNLKINFDYDPVLVQRVRLFPNRKFDSKTKSWLVPINHTKEVVEALGPEGFKISLEVKEIYDKVKKEKKKINRIIEGRFNKKELKLITDTKLPFFNYQKIGVGFLCTTKSGLLGDEPGLGKTIQSLGVSIINSSKKILVICPSTLKQQWYEEIEKWMPGRDIVLIKGTKKQRDSQWKEKSNFYIINYELIIRDIDEINKIDWDLVISDESVRISNPKAKQSKQIKKIKAKQRIAMTGTPLSNSIHDIWNIVDFCKPNYLGNFYQFTERYCIKDRWGTIIGYKNIPELKKKLHSVMIRRLKKDVLHELPDKLYEIIYIDLDPEEKKIYNAIKDTINDELKEYQINTVLEDKYISNAIVKMVRLRQATCSLELLSEHIYSPKLEALKELLKDILHEEKKTIIFTEFKEMAKILNRELKEYHPLLFTGDTSQEERDEVKKLFNSENKHQILVMSPAGGVGLNLQRSNYVIHYDIPWSLERVEQREGRAHRIGQKNKLTVFKLIVKDTIDEYILKVLYKKQKLSDELLVNEKKKEFKKVKMTKKDIRKILDEF